MLRERRVTLVRDACGYWHHDDADMALRQTEAKGCEIIETETLVNALVARAKAASHARRRRFVA
jgi:hypothetical protein